MRTGLILALVAALVAAPGFAQQKDIVDTAVAAGSFKTLATALTEAGLVDTLKSKGPFTVFAPTDAAFAKLPEGTIATLLKPENKQKLIDILTYHVVAGRMPAAKVVKQAGLVTVNGQRVDLAVSGKSVTIDGVKIVKTDINCSNGVIHVIDAVILPAGKNIVETAVGAGSFKTLAAALKAGGLIEALSGKGPFTVFAPTDEAFAKLPEGTVATLLKPENKQKLVDILTYHVASGRYYSEQVVKTPALATLQGQKVSFSLKKGAAYADDAKIVKTDIDASNGVIHVINRVIMPSTPKDAGKTETGRVERMIMRAIDAGAPLYNEGNAAACAAVYAFCAETLMDMPDAQVNNRQRHMLKKAMRSMRHTNDMDRRAWIMREALDGVLANSRREMARSH